MRSGAAYRLAQNVVIALASLAPYTTHAQGETDGGAAVGECRRMQGTGERLACYDRAFPPLADGAAAAPAPSAPTSNEPGSPPPDERAVASSSRAQIVEVTMPSVTTTVLVAADGRVFTRESTTVVVRWPATPFDVSIETSRLGNSTFLIHPRTGERVRVVVRD
jgi:hypothetical protein